MSVRNLMEDVVAGVADAVLRNQKDLQNTAVNRDDIVAFVLNRIQPRYTTSERGVLHGTLQVKFDPQQYTDILFSVHEAIAVIKQRRASELEESGVERSAEDLAYSVSHIVGEVLEETTLAMVPDVEVTLLAGGAKARMIDSGWKNPYTTNRATKGYYHFWPEYSAVNMAGKKKAEFTLIFRHPLFEEARADISVNIYGSRDVKKSHTVPMVLMRAEKGVDLGFLFSEK